MRPYAWEDLKRVLRSKEIRFDTLERMYSLLATVSLGSEPLSIDINVILIGDRYLYYQLYDLAPEFAELFKVTADFEEQMLRIQENQILYARLIASTVQNEGLLDLERDAVDRVIEHGAHSIKDSTIFSPHMGDMKDLLSDLSYWA